jgi:hypothetical protein
MAATLIHKPGAVKAPAAHSPAGGAAPALRAKVHPRIGHAIHQHKALQAGGGLPLQAKAKVKFK